MAAGHGPAQPATRLPVSTIKVLTISKSAVIPRSQSPIKEALFNENVTVTLALHRDSSFNTRE